MNEAKFQAKLREYAKLIVKIGANVQKGQRVRLQAGVDQVLLTQMVTEECYQAGASYVEVIWECGEINKCIISMPPQKRLARFRTGKKSVSNR